MRSGLARLTIPAVLIPAVLGLAACSGSDAPRQLSTGPGAYELSLAQAGHRLVAAWHDSRNGGSDIYLRFVDSAGRPVGDEHRLTEASGTEAVLAYEPSIAAFSNTSEDAFVAVTWYERMPDDTRRAKLGLWSKTAGFAWLTRLGPDAAESRIPVVEISDGKIFCAWAESHADGNEHVVAGWWDRDGNMAGSPVRLGDAGSTTWNLNAASSGDDGVRVAWDSRSNSQADEIYLASVNGIEVQTIRLTADDGADSKYPDIAIAAGRVAISWTDRRDGNRENYLFTGILDDLHEIEAEALRVTDTPGASIGAYLAWQAETIGLAWSETADDRVEVLFRRFSESGTPLGEAVNLSRSQARSMIPAIVPWQGGFAIAWNDVTGTSNAGHDPNARSAAVYTLLR